MRLAPDGLPEGFFEPADMEFYRWLANQVPAGGRLVEIGCHIGRSACVAGPVIKKRSARMVCVDLLSEDNYFTFVDHLQHFDLGSTVETRLCPSLVAASTFGRRQIDAVFIDADHAFTSVVSDIRAWWPTLKNGGIMAGHDYYENQADQPHCAGVRQAVIHEFEKPDGVTGSCWFVRKTMERTCKFS